MVTMTRTTIFSIYNKLLVIGILSTFITVATGAPKIEIIQGDITTAPTIYPGVVFEAIVNAANTGLLGGGGVDGAIHKAAGPGLKEECRTIPEIRKDVRCETGNAKITGSHNLGLIGCRYVIHTPGPVWVLETNPAWKPRINDSAPDLLRASYHNCLRLAVEHKITSIAFPSISTGGFSFPLEPAARIAIETVRSWDAPFPAIVYFVLFDEVSCATYEQLLGLTRLTPLPVVTEMTGNRSFFSPEFIPVGPDSSFELSGEFRSVGTTPSIVYFGVDCYDSSRRSILTCSFSYYPGTETKLINPCTSTDTAMIVEDASRWKPSQNGCIAFDIDDSGRDLPNYNTSNFGITAVRQIAERQWEVQLSGQIGKTYLANTKIREHFSAGGFVYCCIPGGAIPSEWTTYTGTVSSGGSGCRFYPFTKYIRIVILGNYHQPSSAVLQFRNVRLR